MTLAPVVVLWPPFGGRRAPLGEGGPTYLVSVARILPGEAVGSIARAVSADPVLISIPRTLADEPSSLGPTRNL